MAKRKQTQTEESKFIKRVNQQMKNIAETYDNEANFYSGKFFTALTSEIPKLASVLKEKKSPSGAIYYAIPNTKEFQKLTPIIQKELEKIKKYSTAGVLRKQAKQQAKNEERKVNDVIERKRLFNKIIESREKRYNSSTKSAYFNAKYKNRSYADLTTDELKQLVKDLDDESLEKYPENVSKDSNTTAITNAFIKEWEEKEKDVSADKTAITPPKKSN